MSTRLFLTICTGLALSASAPAWSAGYTPDLAEFSGADSLAFPPDGSLDLAGGGTIEFWVQPDWQEDPGFDPVIVSNIGKLGPSYMVVMLGSRKGIGVMAGEKFETLPFDFTDNRLHYVAVSDFGDDNLIVLIDNKLIGSLPLGFRSLPSNGFFIASADGTENQFKGAIAGLRIWDLPVDPDDLAIYAMQPLVDADGGPHPDISSLVGVSDFTKRTFSLIEPMPIGEDESDEVSAAAAPAGELPAPLDAGAVAQTP